MIYLKCCCDNGLIPCQTLVVEDSPIGRVAATLSGCHVCAVASPDGVQMNVIKEHIIKAEEKNTAMIIDTRWKSDVQVVIPMAGLGNRFMVAGYNDPKPLIKIGYPGIEQPMISWVVNNMNISGAQFIFIVRKEHLDNSDWNIKNLLETYAPGCKIVVTDKVTEGPACSVLLAFEVGVLDTNKPLLIANSDQYLEWDPNAFLYQSQGCDGSISVFKQPDKNDKKWSYVALNDYGYVECVKEKEVISDLASTGIYYWSRAGDFYKYANAMISDNEKVNNEFYVAPVYNRAILDGKKIKSIKCNKMWGLGVPKDLEEFKSKFLCL
jgi:dTDP-glucose pyrophosphorylase